MLRALLTDDNPNVYEEYPHDCIKVLPLVLKKIGLNNGLTKCISKKASIFLHDYTKWKPCITR